MMSNKDITSVETKCLDVEEESESEVTIRLLETSLQDRRNYHSLSASEVGIKKKVAIIRSPSLSLNIVNPKITKLSDKSISFQETCCTFPGASFNCLRFSHIEFENGFNKSLIKLDGYNAYIVQHEIDHFNNIYCINRIIRMAVVREDGSIKPNDLCVCGSKKRFKDCCQFKF